MHCASAIFKVITELQSAVTDGLSAPLKCFHSCTRPPSHASEMERVCNKQQTRVSHQLGADLKRVCVCVRLVRGGQADTGPGAAVRRPAVSGHFAETSRQQATARCRHRGHLEMLHQHAERSQVCWILVFRIPRQLQMCNNTFLNDGMCQTYVCGGESLIQIQLQEKERAQFYSKALVYHHLFQNVQVFLFIYFFAFSEHGLIQLCSRFAQLGSSDTESPKCP